MLEKNIEVEEGILMDNEMVQDEFTFKKVWSLIKASVVRGVVFCVIAALVMGIVSAIVLVSARKTSEVVSATITYAHEGIEQGNAPDGTNLNVNRIKSPQIVKLAIDAYNLTAPSSEKIDVNNLSLIVQNIEVKGHLPANILSQIRYQSELGEKANTELLQELLNEFPSQYSLRISNFQDARLTQKQAVALVDEILNQYVKNFKETYGSPSLLDNLVSPEVNKDEDIMSFEFIELYSIYETNIKKALNYLNTHSNENPLFRSSETGKTFKDIADELSLVQETRLFQLETFILQNGLATDIDYTLEYLLTIRRQYVQQQKDASDKAEAVAKMIKDYKQGDIILTVGPNGETIIGSGGPTEAYDNLIRLQTTYVSQAVTHDTNVALVDQRLEYFANLENEQWAEKDLPKNTDANREKATAMSNALTSEINKLFELANKTATDFYDVEYMKNAVNITMPAAYLVESESLIKLMLVVSVAVVFLAAIGAIITTHIVLSNKAKAPKKSEQE